MKSSASSTTAESSLSAAGLEEARRSASERIGLWVRRKWRIDTLLGVGGMAAVYACTHRNGSRVALKILHTEFARDEGLRDRFLREGYVANKVTHPGRVAILDDDETDHGEPFLVMELLEGETLQQLWKRKPQRRVPVEEALSIAEAVLDTLIPFHELQIIHRDLKPANIFITQSGVVKLLDFGVAQLREAGREITRAGTALGTPSYMSPEQAMGKTHDLDCRSDLYAVGATLYAVLGGQRLHHNRSSNEAFILAATQPAPSLARTAPDLPVEVIAYVDRALQWDRRARFQDARSMRDAARELLGRSPDSGVAVPAEAAASGAEPAKPEEPTDEELFAEPPKVEELFKRLELLLPALRQYGPDHPETTARIRPFFEAISEAVRNDPERIRFTVHPFCFACGEHTVWEPAPPADAVPYNLSAAGIEQLQIIPGVAQDEVTELCKALIIEPLAAGHGGEDIATALWEAQLDHIKCKIRDSFTEADARDQERFFGEADDLLDAMGREDLAEVAAMALAAGTQDLDASSTIRAALDMDPAALAALGSQLSPASHEWHERYLDAAAEAYVDALERGDAELLLGPLGHRATELIRQGCYQELFGIHEALRQRLADLPSGRRQPRAPAGVTAAMFSPATLRSLLETAAGGGSSQPDDTRQLLLSRLPQVLQVSDDSFLSDCLEIANATADERVQSLLLDYLERVIPGHEQAVMARLSQLRPLLAQRVLSVLGAAGGAAVEDLIEQLRSSPSPVLRCEAIAQLASPQELCQELLKLLDSHDWELRSAALSTMVRHQVRAIGPALVRLVEREDFVSRPPSEQRQVFETLMSLSASRAEALLSQIVDQHGLMADDRLDRTRIMAAGMLGEIGASEAALTALDNAQRLRPWNPQQLRDVAAAAAQQVSARKALSDGAPEP